METMALKARPKAVYDELWQLSILCKQLKNGDRNYKNTEGVTERWFAVQEEVHACTNHFSGHKTAYLDFMTALLQAKVPLYTVSRIQKVSEQYRQHVRFVTHLSMISHYTEWEQMPKTDAAWDYFINFVPIDRNFTAFYKTNMPKIEKVADLLHFDMTVENFQDGLGEAWKKEKFNKPIVFEKIVVGFRLKALGRFIKQPNLHFFQEICQLMHLKDTFLMGLTEVSFSGFLGLFNRFWLREMPTVFTKMGRKTPKNPETTHKPQLARFFEMWLKSKYPKMFERAMIEQNHIPKFYGKWSFRQVIEYLPPVLLVEWGNYAPDSWEFAFMAHLANGNSPRTFSLPPRYRLSKRAAHLFTTSGAGMGIDDTLRFAMMSALGASSFLQGNLKPFVDNYSAQLLEDTVRFFIKENERVESFEDRTLFNYINHIVEETGAFSFKGRTMASLHRANQEWQRDIVITRLKAHKEQKWAGAKLKDMVFKNQAGKVLHQFVQLKNAYDLAVEGETMHHCVGGYAWQCIEHGTSIWSLRRMDKNVEVSLVTVEIVNKKIVQARGAYNRDPLENERALIQKWADTEGVLFSERVF